MMLRKSKPGLAFLCIIGLVYKKIYNEKSDHEVTKSKFELKVLYF